MGMLLWKKPIIMSESWKKTVGETVGLDVLKDKEEGSKTMETSVVDEFGLVAGSLRLPVTTFVAETAQKADGHVMSRGFDVDGFERVMMRGQFGGWQKVSVLAEGLGRRAFAIQSAGKAFVVYVGKTVRVECQAKMFVDKDGVAHDLTKAYVDYNLHLSMGQEIEAEQAVGMFAPGDEVAVMARYSDGVFEAMLMSGFDCQM